MTAHGERARVLIVDSSELMRRGIGDLLGRDNGLTVVGEMDRSHDVPQACQELNPDVVLLGACVNGGGRPSAEATLHVLETLVSANERASIIVLLDGTEPHHVFDAMRAGATGVLMRDSSADVLLQTIDDVLAGGGGLDPRLTRVLFEQAACRPSTSHPNNGGTRFPARLALSARQLEVLQLAARGLKNKEIAATLGVKSPTIKVHLTQIYRKLGVHDRGIRQPHGDPCRVGSPSGVAS